MKVVHIDADHERLLARRIVPHEHAVVRVVELAEPHDVAAPWEKLSLQATASLRDSIDRFDDFANHGKTILADDIGTGRLLAINDFALEKVALEVRRH